MEQVLSNGFCELGSNEVDLINGGKVTAAGVYDATCKAVTAGAAGCIAASFVPAGAPAYMVCVITAGVVSYIWDNV